MTTEAMQQYKDQLFSMLKENAYFQENIVLSSGKESDYYIDARRVTLSPRGAYLSAMIILDLIKDEHVDAIGGPTLGADPMVGAIAVLSYQEKRPLNTFIIRKSPKSHGKQQQIEGPLLSDSLQVILIDDVATTGKAFVQSIEVLKQNGLSVKKAICIVDREEGAQEALAQYGCELIPLFKASDFIN